MGLLTPNGSNANIIEGTQCPFQYAGGMMNTPNGPAVIGAPGPCIRSCAAFDKDLNDCSFVLAAKSFYAKPKLTMA